ncbi:hypothetical protein [Streptomyces flavidovirens]|uniref:Integral membrane protein n=1 Tax=Streptomyces flavidovirens TaxID=67298 RepID=A0ABW6RPY0_9ACTN
MEAAEDVVRAQGERSERLVAPLIGAAFTSLLEVLADDGQPELGVVEGAAAHAARAVDCRRTAGVLRDARVEQGRERQRPRWAAGWTVMLICAVATTALVLLVECLFPSMGQHTSGDVSEIPTPRVTRPVPAAEPTGAVPARSARARRRAASSPIDPSTVQGRAGKSRVD